MEVLIVFLYIAAVTAGVAVSVVFAGVLLVLAIEFIYKITKRRRKNETRKKKMPKVRTIRNIQG